MLIDCNGKEYETINPGHIDNLIGRRFGDLVVLDRVRLVSNNKTCWLCLCENCGNEICVPTGNLNSGNTTSCGCKKRKENKMVDEVLNGLYSCD